MADIYEMAKLMNVSLDKKSVPLGLGRKRRAWLVEENSENTSELELKLETNRGQTEDKTRDKLETNQGQTEDKVETILPNKKETGDKLGTKLRTNWGQKVVFCL